jgi:hypothetical protein
MKQGILITAYHEIDQLRRLINFFNDDYSIYIHFDKKACLSKAEIEEFRNARNVAFLSTQFTVNWGGINSTKSMLLLATEALKNSEIEYFHLISGQDFPIKSKLCITNFLVENKGKEFVSSFELPSRKWEGDGGLDRITRYNFFDLFNAKTGLGKFLVFGILKTQQLLRIRRKIQPGLPRFYGGSTWWTLSYPCLKYVVDYTRDQPSLLKRLNFSFAAGEIYVPTIIMNSPFRERVENTDLRFINWQYKNGSCPAFLDESDYDDLSKSNAIFARKLRSPISDKLMEKIELKINNQALQ